jgi:uncharacterized protein YqeY
MSIQQEIQAQMRQAILEKDEDTKSTLRFILGEFSRGKDKEITDERAIKIIRKAVEDEESVNGSERFIEILKGYIPEMAEEAEILDWINKNIDFSQVPNKMMAMKPILAHFAGRTDGNKVKSILQELP